MKSRSNEGRRILNVVSASAWLRLGAMTQPATVEFTESLLSWHYHLLTASLSDTAHHAVRPSGGRQP